MNRKGINPRDGPFRFRIAVGLSIGLRRYWRHLPSFHHVTTSLVSRLLCSTRPLHERIIKRKRIWYNVIRCIGPAGCNGRCCWQRSRSSWAIRKREEKRRKEKKRKEEDVFASRRSCFSHVARLMPKWIVNDDGQSAAREWWNDSPFASIRKWQVAESVAAYWGARRQRRLLNRNGPAQQWRL